MTVADRLFLMLDEEQSYGQLVTGPDAARAVEAHYGALDAWCAPPSDAEISEEFVVILYEVPAALAENVTDRFESLDGNQFPGQVAVFLQENPNIRRLEVNVSYTAAEGAKASEFPALPDLFGRGDES